ncbi:MAG: DUF1080 domain-containing protein [Kiritimatiellae bacterium]|nr:DUF1080 domain-containing protein [Kiritimatiellia bacterium]
MIKTHAILFSFVVSILCSGIAVETSRADEQKDWVDLFNGKDLAGWDVLKCEAVVEDGMLLLKSGDGLVQTKQQFADFILDVEWKALNANQWDSGIYFRYTSVPQGGPWPRRYQVNIRKGMEGNVGALPGAKSKGLIVPGDWNRFQLTVRGSEASLEINGKPAWKADGLKTEKGFISLQAEVPHGGQFLFRKVRIKVLPAANENK